MCAEELSREFEEEIHLKKKEVVQKLTELSKFESELQEKEMQLAEKEEELRKLEKHLTTWEGEIKKIAGMVADEKKRIRQMTESIERLEEEPSMEETPVDVDKMIPGDVENIPEEEPALEEPTEGEIVVDEDHLNDLFDDEELAEEVRVEEAPKKRLVKKVVSKKKKKKFGLFR